MMTSKDHELVRRLLKGTQEGKTDWLPTANDRQFAASFQGKFAVLVGASQDEEYAWLDVTDPDGTRLHRIMSDDDADVLALFEHARRRALNVDTTIDEILKDLPEDPDEKIPF